MKNDEILLSTNRTAKWGNTNTRRGVQNAGRAKLAIPFEKLLLTRNGISSELNKINRRTQTATKERWGTLNYDKIATTTTYNHSFTHTHTHSLTHSLTVVLTVTLTLTLRLTHMHSHRKLDIPSYFESCDMLCCCRLWRSC